jgi:hypothetical protein
METPVVIGFKNNRGMQPADTTLDSIQVIAGNANYGLKYVDVSSIQQFLDPNTEQTEFAIIIDTIFEVHPDSTPISFDFDTVEVDTSIYVYDTISCDTTTMICEVDSMLRDTVLFNVTSTPAEYEYFDSLVTRRVVDNLILTYTPVPHLISHDCGFAMYYENLKINTYTKNYIDTVIITNKKITNVPQQNMQIRF